MRFIKLTLIKVIIGTSTFLLTPETVAFGARKKNLFGYRTKKNIYIPLEKYFYFAVN